MKKHLLALLLTLCCLTACGAPAEDPFEDTPVSENPVLHAEAPPVSVAGEPELRPYEAWTFETEPFPVTTEAYGDMFSLKEAIYRTDGAWEFQRPDRYSDYQWYGVPELFPFVSLADTGLCEGSFDWMTNTCDEAWAIAARYYSAAIEYDAPDGTHLVWQESNYPQFCSDNLVDHRWYWACPGGDFSPNQPASYTSPIQIQAAELNGIYIESTHFLDEESYQSLSLSDHTQGQNQWVTQCGMEERLWCEEQGIDDHLNYEIPESDRYYAATGLTILNGDSRTEEAYFSRSRARDIRITINGEYTRELTLTDSPAPQLISLDYTQHTIVKPLDITIEVLSSYSGETPDVCITEIGVGIDSNLPQGR